MYIFVSFPLRKFCLNQDKTWTTKFDDFAATYVSNRHYFLFHLMEWGHTQSSGMKHLQIREAMTLSYLFHTTAAGCIWGRGSSKMCGSEKYGNEKDRKIMSLTGSVVTRDVLEQRVKPFWYSLLACWRFDRYTDPFSGRVESFFKLLQTRRHSWWSDGELTIRARYCEDLLRSFWRGANSVTADY